MSSSLLLYSRAYSRHTEYVVMITNGGSTKIINFMTPPPPSGKGCFGRSWPDKPYSENAQFLLYSYAPSI